MLCKLKQYELVLAIELFARLAEKYPDIAPGNTINFLYIEQKSINFHFLFLKVLG